MSSSHPTRAFDAAILDLDGTLVDTVGDFAAALTPMLAELGRAPVSEAFIRLNVGKGSENLVRRALAEAGAPAAAFDGAMPRYHLHYERINGAHSSVYAGVVEGLAALRAQGLKLACVTNKPGDAARTLLAAKGLAASLDIVFGGDAFARKKPDPQPLWEACKAMGTAPARTLMIGDSSNDAAAARAAGCPVVLMRYGYNHGEPVEAVGADAVFDRLDDVAAWVRGRNGG